MFVGLHTPKEVRWFQECLKPNGLEYYWCKSLYTLLKSGFNIQILFLVIINMASLWNEIAIVTLFNQSAYKF